MFKKIMGAFVELEDSPNAAPAAPVAAPTPGVPPIKSHAAVNSAVHVPTQSHVPFQTNTYDPAMLEMLQNKVTSRSTPYTALLEHAAAFADVIPDETMRLKAAGKAVTKDGSRSVTSILQAIDVHVADVEGERMRFKQTTDTQVRMKSGKLREQAASLEQQNQANAAEIERLQAQIAKLQEVSSNNATSVNDLTNQANQAEAEIVATAAAFERTVEFIKNDLVSKKSMLATVLS